MGAGTKPQSAYLPGRDPACVANDGGRTPCLELEAIGIFSSFGGVQHFWSPRFRSNLVYGYVNSDNPGFASGDTFDNTNYLAADLIWSPYRMTTIGAEYLWGRREDKDGASGTGNRFLFSTRFDF